MVSFNPRPDPHPHQDPDEVGYVAVLITPVEEDVANPLSGMLGFFKSRDCTPLKGKTSREYIEKLLQECGPGRDICPLLVLLDPASKPDDLEQGQELEYVREQVRYKLSQDMPEAEFYDLRYINARRAASYRAACQLLAAECSESASLTFAAMLLFGSSADPEGALTP